MFAQVSADLHDENQENVQPGKSGPSQGPAGGRVVLGVLQGNRAPRVQPQRSSRQQHQQALGQQGINDENFGKVAAGKAASKQPAFSIHVDEPDGANRKRPTALKKSMSEENLLELTSAVTSLGRRKPLAPIPIECSMDISFDSPMVLDMSVIHEGEEKPVNANEVPDYADDIHTYLREMEYLGELSLIDADPFLKYLPSALAAASFILANYTLSCIPWTEPLVQLTGYTFQELKPCIVDLHRTFIGAATHQQQSVREKYKTAKYHAVSLIDPPETFTLS